MKQNKSQPWLTSFYWLLFVLLILGGVWVKRGLGHPEFVVFFHLPAAVFLVLGGLQLKQIRQAQYDDEISQIRQAKPPAYSEPSHTQRTDVR